MKIACGIIVLWLTAGCAMTDHSRKFVQEVKCDGDVHIYTEVLLEKSGSEASEADQQTDAQLEVPVSMK